MVAQMKLAWWREALGRLDNAPPPAEPLLQAVAASLPAIGRGAAIARLADGWEFLAADDDLRAEDFQGFAEERGARLFRLSAQCLGSEPVPGLEAAGRCWALIDLARHASKASERDTALAAAAAEREQLPERWPKGLRPLGMLTVLAARDGERAMLAPVASPSRMLRMLAHRLSGR
jgi:phytoene synthase